MAPTTIWSSRRVLANCWPGCRRSSGVRTATQVPVRWSLAPTSSTLVLSVARLHGEIIELTQRQYELALVLFRNTGRLLSRQYLLEAVWGLNDSVQTRTLDIHISQLRNQLSLADNGWRIHSVYAHGYRLEPLA